MTKQSDSESFVFKYFLSCCAATIAESGKFFVIDERFNAFCLQICLRGCGSACVRIDIRSN